MSSIRDQVVRRHRIPGGWTEQSIRFAGREWRLVLPANADEFLNQLEVPSAGQEPDVYWAKLWPTALTMAERIPELGLLPQAKVLELGCGIGVVGLAALAAGAEVTLSDHVSIAVEVAMANAELNGFKFMHGQVLEWSQPPNSRFDVILGSDILYDQSQHAALVKLLDQVLAVVGTAWIGDPGRYHVPLFVDLAWDHGFDVEVFDEVGQPLDSLTGGRFQLLRLRRQTGTARTGPEGARGFSS